MATQKSFNELLMALNEFDAAPRRRLLVKAAVQREAQSGAQRSAVSKQELGELIKSAVSDAVASGRLSGTSAVAGLRALGLED